MLKIAALVALVAAMASATAIIPPPSIVRREMATSDLSPLGIVNPVYRCGGVGTPLQLRISGCEGRCTFIPGQIYNCEKDFIASSAYYSLTLKVEICLDGSLCTQILEYIVPNSSVDPGLIYTLKYSIVPNDILSGQDVEFRGYISNTNSGLLEICMTAGIHIA